MQEHAHSTSLWIKHARLQQFSASANTCYARKREKPWVSQKEEASSGVAHHRRASTQAVASHVAREGLLRTQISSTAATRHHHSRNSQIQSMVARPPSQPQLARRCSSPPPRKSNNEHRGGSPRACGGARSHRRRSRAEPISTAVVGGTARLQA
jgi:hypothetical protein